MDTCKVIYEEKNTTIEINRIFDNENKSLKELILDLIKQKYEETRLSL